MVSLDDSQQDPKSLEPVDRLSKSGVGEDASTLGLHLGVRMTRLVSGGSSV